MSLFYLIIAHGFSLVTVAAWSLLCDSLQETKSSPNMSSTPSFPTSRLSSRTALQSQCPSTSKYGRHHLQLPVHQPSGNRHHSTNEKNWSPTSTVDLTFVWRVWLLFYLTATFPFAFLKFGITKL
jgi:hypothetical protein